MELLGTWRKEQSVKPKKQQTAPKPVAKVDTAVYRSILLPYNPLRAWSRNGKRRLQRIASATA